MRFWLLLLAMALALCGCTAHQTPPAVLTEGTADLLALASGDELPLHLTILSGGQTIDAGQPDILTEVWNGRTEDPIEYWRYLYRKYDGADEIPLTVSGDAELIVDFGAYTPGSVTIHVDEVTYATDGYLCGETPQNPQEVPYTVNYTLDEAGQEVETLSLPLNFSRAKVIYLVLDCEWSGGNRVVAMTAFARQSD